jgi:hypothetical protein
MDNETANTVPEVRFDAASSVKAIFSSDRVEKYRQGLEQELQPVGFTESLVLRDLAHCAARMDLLESTLSALHRQGARAMTEMTAAGNCDDSFANDLALAGSVTSGRIDEVFRQKLGNSRGFYRALTELKKLQTDRLSNSPKKIIHGFVFSNEDECQQYLLQRFQEGRVPCRKCDIANGGCWIASRHCWECAGCRTQNGVRTGTVMEKSPLPLLKWFKAIQLLFCQPTIQTAEIAAQIDISRLPTVRTMATKIREAMAQENASQLLAGLDSKFIHTT